MERHELEELRLSIYEKLRRAIAGGDTGRALGLLEEIDRNRINYRNIFLTWIDFLLTYIADKLGEEAVYETMRMWDRRTVRPTTSGAFGPRDATDRIRQRAYLWTSLHGANIDEIEEDEEKFIVKFKCPSGGTIRTREQFGKTNEAYPWTYGQKGFSYYCIHCVTSFDIMTIEQLGYPAWVTLPQPEGRCVQHLYKDPKSVPEEYYRRVGMEKKTAR